MLTNILVFAHVLLAFSLIGLVLAHSGEAAGLSGAFILVNSIAGLAGLLTVGATLPPAIPLWIAAVVTGGLIGSWLGAARFSILNLRRVLAFILLMAAAKLVFLP